MLLDLVTLLMAIFMPPKTLPAALHSITSGLCWTPECPGVFDLLDVLLSWERKEEKG